MDFNENLFYEFEYIPTMAQYPASYRVYNTVQVFRSFSIIEFKQYFQKYWGGLKTKGRVATRPNVL